MFLDKNRSFTEMVVRKEKIFMIVKAFWMFLVPTDSSLRGSQEGSGVGRSSFRGPSSSALCPHTKELLLECVGSRRRNNCLIFSVGVNIILFCIKMI